MDLGVAPFFLIAVAFLTIEWSLFVCIFVLQMLLQACRVNYHYFYLAIREKKITTNTTIRPNVGLDTTTVKSVIIYYQKCLEF